MRFFSVYDFESEIIEHYKASYPEKFKDAENFSISVCVDGYDDLHINIYGDVLETDAEFNRRIKNEEKQEALRESIKSKIKEKELKEYERLRKKYGP